MNENPRGLNTPADLHKIAQLIPQAFQPGVLGENWLGWLNKALF